MLARTPEGMAPSQDELKKQAWEALSSARRALQVGFKAVDDYVRSGMIIGLGTGSTAYFAVERVGEKLRSGELKDVVAVPTSKRTQEQAEKLGIPLATLDTQPKLDVAIDGADSVDPSLNLVKGGGGAHFREKIVEATGAGWFLAFVCCSEAQRKLLGCSRGANLDDPSSDRAKREMPWAVVPRLQPPSWKRKRSTMVKRSIGSSWLRHPSATASCAPPFRSFIDII